MSQNNSRVGRNLPGGDFTFSTNSRNQSFTHSRKISEDDRSNPPTSPQYHPSKRADTDPNTLSDRPDMTTVSDIIELPKDNAEPYTLTCNKKFKNCCAVFAVFVHIAIALFITILLTDKEAEWEYQCTPTDLNNQPVIKFFVPKSADYWQELQQTFDYKEFQYDCMPSYETIVEKGWDNPNFWAKFPLWGDKKQTWFNWMWQHDLEPALMDDQLYLGSLGTALNQSILDKHGITHIMGLSVELNAMWPEKYTYINIFTLKDYPTVLLDEVHGINKQLEAIFASGGRVLVHCFYGRNRSASVIIGWMMYSRGWDYQRAHDHTNHRRNIWPFWFFANSLKTYRIMLDTGLIAD